MRPVPAGAKVLLAGLSHRTRADREELAKIQVEDEFERALRLWDGARHWRPLLERGGIAFAVVDRPREHGCDWRDLLEEAGSRIVVVDSLEAGPDRSAILAHLERGGNLLVTTPDATTSRWDDPLFRDALRIDYGGPENERTNMVLSSGKGAGNGRIAAHGKPGSPGIPFEIVPCRPGAEVMTFSLLEGAEPFLALEGDGRVVGVKVSRNVTGSSKRFRAVVLGFHLTDLKDEAMEEQVLRAALDYLGS